MSGEADYKPSPGRGDALHLIGPAKHPVWIGPKKDIPNLFTPDFWFAYEHWRRFNLGLGLPEARPWTEQDQWLMDTIAAFEEHFRAHFSPYRYLADMLMSVVTALARR